MNRSLGALAFATLSAAALACLDGPEPESAPAPLDEALEVETVSPLADEPAPPALHLAPATRQGSALARAATDDALYLADEDNAALRRIPLPLPGTEAEIEALPLPGRPAQVVALAGRLLVTVRDPGLLLVIEDTAEGLREVGRVALPADAWGLAVTEDERVAVVTSAWTHRITGVALGDLAVRWSVDAEREPRAVAITPEGVAYVSHLVGSALTRVDGLDADAPRVSRVDLPAAPLRAPSHTVLGASLGWSLALSPDGRRLFAPRHALGAQAMQAWFGVATVDVLRTGVDEPLSPSRPTTSARAGAEHVADALHEGAFDLEGVAPLGHPAFVQPRAAVYRASTRTLLVAGEGDHTLVELDARALAPALTWERRFPLAATEGDRQVDAYTSPHAAVPVAGGSPKAIALSADERTAYVYCAGTFDVVTVRLERDASEHETRPWSLRVAPDPYAPEVSRGRRLFLDATDPIVSGGLACAGCHPEGRDDGHVWHEHEETGFTALPRVLRVGQSELGAPRQTPTLAGRVAARGPYGWKAESETLEHRIRASFGLHRWRGSTDVGPTLERPALLAAFLRRGLVEPPRDASPLTAEERRGAEIFADPTVGCATCHTPERDFTDRVAYPLARPADVFGFASEQDRAFKTPSLRHVGGTAPYFHDGRAPTLDAALFASGDAMGKTSHLSSVERAALVAYLRRL